nr:olfactory receptor 6P1-like [Pelodiscus sinensis]|eukprot:XP_014437338.1 olfactory receptor 6P1-like [Pelodiscus sinensis]
MEGRNQTPIVELILVGFGNDPELQPLLFLLFLVIYIVAVAGNLLIIVLVVADRHLHTPMYYFVANLSAVEICYVSTTLPRLIGSLVTGDRTISLQNCIVQFHFYIILTNAECVLLTEMCIDRYLAICHPLRYPALMNGRPPAILYKILSVTSTILIPLINPVIYCLRNKEVHQALRKAVLLLSQLLSFILDMYISNVLRFTDLYRNTGAQSR